MESDLSTFSHQVGFIGAGNMASALARGMVRAGLSAQNLSLADQAADKVSALQSELGVCGCASNSELVEKCSTIFLAVKPAIVPLILEEVRPHAHDQLWISIAAGVSCRRMEDILGSEPRFVRAMPNTPSLEGEGATAICRGRFANNADEDLARSLLGAVGTTEIVSESMMDAVTGLSGSGPAYVMLMIEALADGAVRMGLPRDLALRLSAQTVRGSATLLQRTGKHPGELKDMVSSPGGTTIAGIQALEAGGFRATVMNAVIAAAERSKKLSE